VADAWRMLGRWSVIEPVMRRVDFGGRFSALATFRLSRGRGLAAKPRACRTMLSYDDGGPRGATWAWGY
jgi:hypothetical protein